MNLYKSSIRLLVASSPVFSSTFTSLISLCIRSSSLKTKAKGSALYTISSFFSTSDAIVTSYFRGLPDVKKNKKGFTPLEKATGEVGGNRLVNSVKGCSSLTGFTLVEVMVALIIMLIVFLALMQTALVGIDSNMVNVLRSEAVNIAEIRMNEARNIPFTSILSDSSSPLSDYLDGGCTSGCNDCPPTGFSTGECWCRGVRSISSFKFCTNLTCTEFGGDGNCATDDADNKQINITVGWRWKENPYTHSITTIRTK